MFLIDYISGKGVQQVVAYLFLDCSVYCILCVVFAGSGSLSHSIARAIAPNGRLITHDYSIERVNAANEDFRRHGTDSIVESSQRNVLLDGFAPECKEQKVIPFKKNKPFNVKFRVTLLNTVYSCN